MQPSTARYPQTAEDIEAVLGRFQAWTGSRKTKDTTEGVRELSYEEALRSSRYRWQGRAEAPEIRELGPEPGVIPVASARRVVAPAVSEVSNDDDGSVTYTPSAGSPSASQPDAPRQFRAVLAEKVMGREAPVALARTSATPERQVSMSLRVATSEQALIKVRASEAGISASAYLRQCALEVEQLRAQVQVLMTMAERRSPLALPAAETSRQSRPLGWIERIRERVLGQRSTLSQRA